MNLFPKGLADRIDIFDAAIKKINDESILADIVINISPDVTRYNQYVVENAIKKINDESLLEEITKNVDNNYIEKVAKSRISQIKTKKLAKEHNIMIPGH